MFKVIHFFQMKDGEDLDSALAEWQPVGDYFKSKGCLERKVFKLFDARSGGEEIKSSPYIMDVVWPDKATNDAAWAELPDDLKAINKKFLEKAILDMGLRYID